MKEKGKESKKKMLVFLFRILSIVIIITAFGIMIHWQVENVNSQKIQEELLSSINIVETTIPEKEYSFLTVDFSSFIHQNPDTVGWIHVNNTNINYPVVQSQDNNFYLSHSFDHSSNSTRLDFC